MTQFVSITIDIQEAFDNLGMTEQAEFLARNIGRAHTDDPRRGVEE